MPIGVYPRKNSQLSAVEYFAAKSEKVSNGCIEWRGPKGGAGYGHCPPRYKLGNYVHRAVATLVYGPIPAGMVVRHHCDNKKCINAEHLAIGTQRENVLDTVRRGRKNQPRKFNDEHIETLRRFASYGLRHSELARAFKIDHAYCTRIVRGEKRVPA